MGRKPSVLRICAVICTRADSDLLLRAVDSLLDQTLSRDAYEILVVVNARGRGASAVLEQLPKPPHLRILEEPEPGLSHARNRGWREAAAPLVAFLDDDAVASPHWLARFLEAFEGHHVTRVGCVGGVNEPWWGTRRRRWVTPELLGALAVIEGKGRAEILSPDDIYTVCGSNMGFAVAALEEVGGFNADLGRKGDSLLSGEDNLVQMQLHQRGWRVRHDPEIRVWHFVSRHKLTLAYLVRWAYWSGRSQIAIAKIFRRDYPTAPAHASLPSSSRLVIAKNLLARYPVLFFRALLPWRTREALTTFFFRGAMDWGKVVGRWKEARA